MRDSATRQAFNPAQNHPPRAWRNASRRLLSRAADRDSTGTRRGLQITLGLTWLLDAALQYQPFMFTKAFATSILAPVAAGNPAIIAGPVTASSHLIAGNPALWDAVFATTQLTLAAGLLWRRTVKAALAGTIAWSLSLWWLGEGLGGVLTPAATPLTGAPGAAVLYALIAILIWPARPGDHAATSVAAGSPIGARWATAAWFTLWASAAYLILQAPNRAPHAISHAIDGLAAGEPGWIASLDHTAATAAGSRGTLLAILLAIVFGLTGTGMLLPSAMRAAVLLGVLSALAIWVLGENLGGILTGQGTDPNTGPLLVLLAAAFWPLNNRTARRTRARRRGRDGRSLGQPRGPGMPAADAGPGKIHRDDRTLQ